MSVDYTPLLSLVLLIAAKAVLQGKATLLRIDCGAASSYTDTTTGSYWHADESFIKTGYNRDASSDRQTVLEQLDSLRVFMEQNKNCYRLPTPTLSTSMSTRYFIRATFYYGNYDHLSKPPTFNLEFDGNLWTSVTTSDTQPTFHELIDTPKKDNVSVCLSRTHDKQFPFINILEIWPLEDDMYDGMLVDVAWFNRYRYNYGGENWILGYPIDDYNRVWQPYDPPGTYTVQAPITNLSFNSVNDPPDIAIIYAIEAKDPVDTINLPFALSQTANLAYIAAYFTENREFLEVNQTRLIDIYVEDEYMLTIAPEFGDSTGAWMRIQSNSSLNIQLHQNGSSTLPPVISAIEVYTASDALVASMTLQVDQDGLQELIDTFKPLSGWSGDPCLPNNTAWQWLGCMGNDPPRVTEIDLSGYSLNGPLPEFSQMQALETINLSNNSLNGEIPNFLCTFPNLKQLDLSNNNFSGKVPRSITRNKKITYNVKGNPDLHKPKKKLALTIGLSVGVPLGLLLVVAVVLFLMRRNPPPAQGQITRAELSRIQAGKYQVNQPHQSGSISTQTLLRPSQSSQSIQPICNQESTISSAFSLSMSQQIQGNGPSTPMSQGMIQNSVNPSTFPRFNADELNELLDLHVR